MSVSATEMETQENSDYIFLISSACNTGLVNSKPSVNIFK